MVRTERESDSRRREEKWQTCWFYRDQQRMYRMAQVSTEKLEHTVPAEKKRSRLCQKENEQSHLSKALDHAGGESQGGREPHHGESEGDQSESMERKEWTSP